MLAGLPIMCQNTGHFPNITILFPKSSISNCSWQREHVIWRAWIVMAYLTWIFVSEFFPFQSGFRQFLLYCSGSGNIYWFILWLYINRCFTFTTFDTQLFSYMLFFFLSFLTQSSLGHAYVIIMSLIICPQNTHIHT